MVSQRELEQLCTKAAAKGARVLVILDKAAAREGRTVYSQVTIVGLTGCGPAPMSPIAAAERLRECFAAKGKVTA